MGFAVVFTALANLTVSICNYLIQERNMDFGPLETFDHT